MAEPKEESTPRKRMISEDVNPYGRITIMLSPYGKEMYPVLAKYVNSQPGLTLYGYVERAIHAKLLTDKQPVKQYDWDKLTELRAQSRKDAATKSKATREKQELELTNLRALREKLEANQGKLGDANVQAEIAGLLKK